MNILQIFSPESSQKNLYCHSYLQHPSSQQPFAGLSFIALLQHPAEGHPLHALPFPFAKRLNLTIIQTKAPATRILTRIY